MAEEKTPIFFPMTRALFSKWVKPFSEDALNVGKPAPLLISAWGIWLWLIPLLLLDLLFLPFLIFAGLRGDEDVRP